MCDAGPKNIRIFVHRRDGVHKKGQEAQVGTRIFPWRKQVHPGIGPHTPVVVLSGAIDACERFFMQQHAQLVPPCHALHQIHQKLVVVYCHVDLLIDRGQFVLTGGHLIVTGTHWYAQLVTFHFQVTHVGIHALGDRTKIVVFQLLVLCCRTAQQGTASHSQVGTGIEKGIIYQKIFLFPAQGGRGFGHFLVEHLCNRYGSLVQESLRAQEWQFVVLSFAAIGDKNGWNAKCFSLSYCHDKGRTRRIPHGITTGLESTAHPARWEGRTVRLLLYQC